MSFRMPFQYYRIGLNWIELIEWKLKSLNHVFCFVECGAVGCPFILWNDEMILGCHFSIIVLWIVMYNKKLITIIKYLDWLQGWFELIVERLNLWHLEKILLVIDLMWDGNMVYILIRILEKFSASIVKKLSVEVFFVSNSIWLALVRMLGHVSKFQKMLSKWFWVFWWKI